jgi:adenylate cyclase
MVQCSENVNIPRLSEIRKRVNKTITDGLQLNMSTEECTKLLRRHVNTKVNLVIMFVDIDNSTKMSLSVSDGKFALIVQIFAQEISNIAFNYDGYVFKYEGDAVIMLFPASYNEALACKNALNCSRAILEIIQEVINPAFKANDMPEITVKIGLAYGKSLIVLYGKSLVKSHVDVVGSSISIASKITSVAKPNQVLVGESIYNILQSSKDSKAFLDNNKFVEVGLDLTEWKYPSRTNTDRAYRVYEFLRG